MKQPFPWKSTLVAAVIAIAIWSIYEYGIKQGLDLKGGTSFLLQMDLSKIDSQGHATALGQAVEIIRKRVDRFGVAEPVIQQIPPDRILVPSRTRQHNVDQRGAGDNLTSFALARRRVGSRSHQVRSIGLGSPVADVAGPV